MDPSSPSSKGRSALVLGAGMVGICTALHLQQRGWTVTLIDRTGPGAEASSGNAGVISRGSIMSNSYPGLIKDLPKMLTGRLDSVRVTLGGLLTSFDWSLRFLMNANAARNREIAVPLNTLLSRCVEEHLSLMDQAGATRHVRDGGWLKLHRSDKSLKKTVLEKEILTALGVAFDTLEPGDIAALEPHLQPIYKGGLHIRETHSVDDPGAVCRAYAALFQKRGGDLRLAEVSRLSENADSVTAHFAGGDSQTADHAVVAMGGWSDLFLKPLGIRTPLYRERGYHRHYRAKGNATLNRPIYDAGGSFVITPMARGIRVTCGVEIAARNAPPSPVQIENIMPRVREAFPLEDTVDDAPWFGQRPSLPDSIPAIGRAREGSRIWTNFGHQHVGFTLGPISGRLLAEMMSGEAPVVDPAPYSLTRFS